MKHTFTRLLTTAGALLMAFVALQGSAAAQVTVYADINFEGNSRTFNGDVPNLVEQGFFSFDDLSVIEPDQLAELSGLSLEDCAPIVEFAEKEAERLEKEVAQQKAEGRAARAAQAAAAADAPASVDATEAGAQPPSDATTADTATASAEEPAAVEEAHLSGSSDASGDVSPGPSPGNTPEVNGQEVHANQATEPEQPTGSGEASAAGGGGDA